MKMKIKTVVKEDGIVKTVILESFPDYIHIDTNSVQFQIGNKATRVVNLKGTTITITKEGDVN